MDSISERNLPDQTVKPPPGMSVDRRTTILHTCFHFLWKHYMPGYSRAKQDYKIIFLQLRNFSSCHYFWSCSLVLSNFFSPSGPKLSPHWRQPFGLPLQPAPALPGPNSGVTCRASGIQRGVLGWYLCVWMCTRTPAPPFSHPNPAVISPSLLLASPLWDHSASWLKWLLLSPVRPTTRDLFPSLMPRAGHPPRLAPCWGCCHGRGRTGGADVLWCGLGTCKYGARIRGGSFSSHVKTSSAPALFGRPGRTAMGDWLGWRPRGDRYAHTFFSWWTTGSFEI